jgi:hypothetical protein
MTQKMVMTAIATKKKEVQMKIADDGSISGSNGLDPECVSRALIAGDLSCLLHTDSAIPHPFVSCAARLKS